MMPDVVVQWIVVHGNLNSRPDVIGDQAFVGLYNEDGNFSGHKTSIVMPGLKYRLFTLSLSSVGAKDNTIGGIFGGHGPSNHSELNVTVFVAQLMSIIIVTYWPAGFTAVAATAHPVTVLKNDRLFILTPTNGKSGPTAPSSV